MAINPESAPVNGWSLNTHPINGFPGAAPVQVANPSGRIICVPCNDAHACVPAAETTICVPDEEFEPCG